MPEVYGEISGLRKSIIDRLEQFYAATVPFGQIILPELASELLAITAQINREVAIYLNRRGQVTAVAVGDVRTVALPELDGRRAENRLCGIRCIHTHPGSDSELSGPDLTALTVMRYDVMVAISENQGVAEASLGFISPASAAISEVSTIGPISLQELAQIDFTYLYLEIERQLGIKNRSAITAEKEKALLVGVEKHGGWEITASLEELAQLAETAGAEVLGVISQKKERPDPALFIGRGKLEEVRLLRQQYGANLVIFDDELSPAQQRNLEQALNVKIIDRTALILDIFAQRARSHEGKLQVELAQLKYNLPRLGGQGLVLSRLGGGIGTRGPGETKLEVDRRRIRGRISEIEKEIDNIRKHRGLHRERRQQAKIPTIALVGYTNAGKSTLLNKLTNAGVLAEDKLFATLDPTTRRITLPSGKETLLTDTVGFIQKLPHQLIAAFRATFEEVVQADLLLHVQDISHPLFEEQCGAVFEVLREFKADTKPLINVYNKLDKIGDPYLLQRLLRQPCSVAISALTGEGIDRLFTMLDAFVSVHLIDMDLLLPYSESGLLSRLYDGGTVHSVEYRDGGIAVKASLPQDLANRLKNFIQGDVTTNDPISG
ncbi:MAG: GTPase HflX [Negativicutes bacterium]|nr:GTPase HflX [Negativicutes bacterium]